MREGGRDVALRDTLSLPDVATLTAAANLAEVKLDREASVLCG